jgi:hypothetical protein
MRRDYDYWQRWVEGSWEVGRKRRYVLLKFMKILSDSIKLSSSFKLPSSFP